MGTYSELLLGRCVPLGDDRLHPLVAGRRPERPPVVVDVERRRGVGKLDPRKLRLGVDVYVRRDARRLVESASAYEPELGPPVLAEDGHLAVGAAVDALCAAAVSRHIDRLRI